MSLVLYGGGIIDNRGSVSGNTFSRSKFGATMRAKTSPVNPNTAKMGLAKSKLVTASRAWATVLTDAQRDTWNAWALTQPQTNVFGQVSYLSGQQWFTKLSVNLVNLGGAAITSPPTSSSYNGLITLTTDATAAGTYNINVTYPANSGTPYFRIFSSWAISPGVRYAAKQLRDIGSTIASAGGAASPTTTPILSLFDAALPDAPFYAGAALFTFVMLQDQDTGVTSPGALSRCIIT